MSYIKENASSCTGNKCYCIMDDFGIIVIKYESISALLSLFLVQRGIKGGKACIFKNTFLTFQYLNCTDKTEKLFKC